MSVSFLSAAYATTLYFNQVIISKINKKERHYFCIKNSALNVGDIVLVKPESAIKLGGDDVLELLITAKDVTNDFTIYGFVSVVDIPDALHNLISGIFEANKDLIYEKYDLIDKNMALTKQLDAAIA